MHKRIFITRAIPTSVTTTLRNKGYEVDVFPKDEIIGTRRLIRALKKKEYDAVISLLTDKLDTEVFSAAPTVKLYANYATGFDNINLRDAQTHGITITNAPTLRSAEAVAEHTIALLYALARNIVPANTFTHNGKYKGWAPLAFLGQTLVGKTLGLIGGGKIGEQVGRIAAALGMQIVYVDVRPNQELETTARAQRLEALDDLLRVADAVSLHVPLTEATHHMIGARELAHMKKTAFLINTARGAVVDEEALVYALQNDVIAGAGLDVFEHEPHIARALRKEARAILTPHIGSASEEAREAMGAQVIENIEAFFAGTVPPNTVEYK